MTGCGTVKIAKEITKATQSVETSLKKIFESPNKGKKEQKMLVEEQEISKEQKEVAEIVKKQIKISKTDLMNKNLKELNLLIGQPRLIREYGNTITARFDSKNCRLFVFMNATLKTPRVEYYELRNIKGELIDRKNDIQLCFKEIKSV